MTAEAKEVFNRYSGNILLGLAGLVVAGIFCGIFWGLLKNSPDPNWTLPLLAIGGVVVLVLLLTVVAIIFTILNLTNKDQAMGLPEGSIRAVIALSLIVLFAILSVFLYQGVSAGGSVNTLASITDTELAQFFKDHPAARGVQTEIAKGADGQSLPVKDAAGAPLKNADGSARYYYKLSYLTPNAVSDDFAKQLLTILGTLMTAITSFYLGAGTATSAARVGEAATAAGSAAAPTLTGLKPPTYSLASGPSMHLEITGTNLAGMTAVKITRAGAQPIAGTAVKATATSVVCDVAVSAATTPAGAAWDVVVEGGGKSVTLKDALTITA